MLRAYGRTWTAVVGIAVMMGVGGCGGSPAPGASSEAASSPSSDPAVAFTQYDKAAQAFECSSAFTAMIDAVEKGDFGAVKDHAHEYRDVVATWDAQLNTISFPAEVRPVVVGLRQHIAAELAALDELAKIDVKDTERITVVERHVEGADAAVEVDGDAVRAALGHPVPHAGIASDQLMLADQTFYVADSDDVSPKWKAAMAAHDLDGAKTANAAEEGAAQAYLDRLATIDWPEGFDGQVTALRDSLQKLIAFDRHQVDVPTAAQIVEATPDQAKPLSDNEIALWNALVKAYKKADPGSACPAP